MNRYRWIRLAAMTGVVALPLMTAGCGIFSQNTAKEIDPPPVETQNEASGSLQQNTTGTETGTIDLQTGETQMTVYLLDSHGYLAPVTLRTTLGGEEKLGQKALEMMVDGGDYADQLPAGFTGIIPKGTQVNGYTESKEKKLATVDFSQSFTDYNAADERKIVEAIAWTLTGLPDVSGVELMLDGTKLTEMPEHAYPLDRPLDRSVGINLEVADGIDYGQSVPVTLYFSSETPDGDSYYVPVTRLINRTDDMLKASIDQLIAGPLSQSQLIGVMTPDVQVKSVVPKDNTITVNLQDEAFMEGQIEPDEMLQAIILSVTENANTSKVQITLNGETNLMTEPVSRPTYVNALKS
ncbi:germination protein M [Paenibacillus cellulosilyticus]|uniref:Germination protein M n=1 Tax=Paenibacillus cellulosilyticus TaxID=375489 RepID=A0A2V2YHI6_9BACL|nr:GerMN domain-containing protein [Paenibacillus cellulosilyticus]PWV92050.1 germination protein M [Paenibacillus cellulosilyticus]QKS46731.1 GerMN domain-containing protein [Paenibacillus cellulosilyticus]